MFDELRDVIFELFVRLDRSIYDGRFLTDKVDVLNDLT